MARKKSVIPDFGKFYEAFRGETDRAAGVLAAAYLEASLERLFRARLLENTPASLFAFRGSLGDFAGKIDLAFSLGWISEDSRNDLHIIRDIRNDFAHDVDHTLSFDEKSIAARTGNLRGIAQIQNFIESSFAAIPDAAIQENRRGEIFDGLVGTSRKRFEVAVATLELVLGKAVEKSKRPEPLIDNWQIMHLGEVRLAPGEAATIDLREGRIRKN